MTRALLAFVAGFTLLLSGAARAQETFENLGGTWWFKIGGKDGGALFIAFTAPQFGNFETADTVTELTSFGFSRTLGGFFEVEAGQPLTFDSKGNVVGELELTDELGDPIGILTLEKGKPNKKFTGWKIRALVEGDGEPVVAKLAGQRVPETFPVLSGGNPEGKLSGKGVKSSAFDLHVTSDTVRGLPAYRFAGAGPALIDKVETPDTFMIGSLMLTPKFEAWGLLENSSAFGTGVVTGKLKLPSGSLVPKTNLLATADRKVRMKAELVEATDPVLEVTPTSFNFGALHLDAHLDRAFEVANVGAGELVGTATLLDGDTADFTIVDDEGDYGPLTFEDEPENVFVRFEPKSAGAKSARILFDIDGGTVGAQIITVTGVGGIPELAVDPNSIDFPETALNTSLFDTITISNVGDGVLTGQAVATGTDFALTVFGQPTAVIPYTLDPGEDLVIAVRFLPTTSGAKTGAVVFTGGDEATVPLTGDTP